SDDRRFPAVHRRKEHGRRACLARDGQQRRGRRPLHRIRTRVHRPMTPSSHRRQLAAILATIVMCAGVLFYTYGRGLAARSIPDQLTDQQYWQMVEDFSEPNGYFRSDNLLSNENAFQHVIPALQSTLPSDGVYLGVGPEQNFTYIAAIKP